MDLRRAGWQDALTMMQHALPRATHRLAVGALVSCLGLAFLWWHPASPIALWRGDVAMGQGRPHAAVAAYDAVGKAHPAAAVRAEALRRSALVWAVDLGQPSEARKRYEWLLPLQLGAADRATILDHLGQLLIDEGRYQDAAQRLREAHDLDPASVEAGDRLVRSAVAATMADDFPRAERTWRRLASLHPVFSARAHLGRANLRLQRGDPVGAFDLYEEAVDVGFDPDVVATARLGMATCLERLGDSEEALALLEGADLPPNILAQRASSIRARDALLGTLD